MRLSNVSSVTTLALLLAGAAQAQTVGSPAPCDSVPNSTGSVATLVATGSDVVGGNPLDLTATSVPPNQFGYFLVSAALGDVPNPGGSQGTLCLSGAIGRFNAQVMSSGPGGTLTASVDTLSLPLTPTVAVQPGETWKFQGWYRDLNPGQTSNFTEAVAVGFRTANSDAAFTTNVTSGVAPLTVNFTNMSGTATGFDWDFGDGGSASDATPQHVYTTPGDYLVTFTTTSPNGPAASTALISVKQGFADVYAEFLQPDPNVGFTCVDCHSNNGFGGLDMDDFDLAYSQLVGVASQCSGGAYTRVIPGDVENSLLWGKLAGPPQCGNEMPLGSTFVGDLDLIRRWIEDGALKD